MIERLESLTDILFGIHEVKNESTFLTFADSIQTAQRLDGLDSAQSLIDYHRMKQRFIKTSLVLFSHYQHIEVIAELLLGLGFLDSRAVLTLVQARFGVIDTAILD